MPQPQYLPRCSYTLDNPRWLWTTWAREYCTISIRCHGHTSQTPHGNNFLSIFRIFKVVSQGKSHGIRSKWYSMLMAELEMCRVIHIETSAGGACGWTWRLQALGKDMWRCYRDGMNGREAGTGLEWVEKIGSGSCFGKTPTHMNVNNLTHAEHYSWLGVLSDYIAPYFWYEKASLVKSYKEGEHTQLTWN